MNAPRTLGAYTIEKELGRGGMGVVYLARDARLNRSVAIKVLPEEVAADPDRLARFEREAKLLAALKHPNVGGIHGLEEADGKRFLVLEHLEGETLARRLDGGPLRATEAIHVCRQIAAALEAAHEAGIIHRDLKPGNVMITDDDEVKVLDFGLAKGDAGAAESGSDLSASPTVAIGATAAGVILGTAAYMSPEQARGRSVDRRTDIWSFGCVLYECLTGKQLFKGETVSDTIAKILERDPDWDALPKDTPDRVRELLRRCLEKKARERLRDIGDARIELEEVESGKTSSISGISQAALDSQYKGKLRVAWGVAAIAAVIAVAMAGMNIGRSSLPPQPLTRFQVTLPRELQLSTAPEDMAISPDGTMIVFNALDTLGTSRLYIRDVASLELRPVPGTESGFQAFWSPDGQHIGFFSEGKLRRVSIAEGQPEVLADVNASRGASWGADYITFATAQGPIYRVPPEGGDVEMATQIDSSAGETAHRFPHFLPDGKHFLYSVLPPRTGQIIVKAASIDGGETTEIMSARSRPVYAEPGYLIWPRGRRLVAQLFNAKSLVLSGKPVPVGSMALGSDNIGAPAVTASRIGTFVQLTPDFPMTRLEWRDERGRTLERLDLEEKSYADPAVSPDGKQAVVTVRESAEESDLWLIDLERMTPTRITFGPGTAYQPFWSPDGEHIFYSSDREGPQELYVKSLASPDEDRILVETDAMFVNPMGWSADGSHVMYSQSGSGTGMDLWVARVDGENPEARPFAATPFNEDEGAISPNGRWVAHTSDASGRVELYVTSFPTPGRKYRISTEGAFGPSWSHDGRRLYFISFDNWIMRADVETGDNFRIVSGPRRVARVRDDALDATESPVEHKWLVVVRATEPVDPTLTVTSGWLREMEQ